MTRIKFSILKKKWVLRLLSKSKYRSKHGVGSVAITHVHKRRIDLSPKGRDTETVVHELVHAYLYEMCTHSADLDNDNLEEIFAELMSKWGYEILELADRIMIRVSSEGSL